MAVQSTVVEVVKSSPPVTVTALTVYGMPITDVVQAATLVYIVLQIVWMIVKMFRKENK